MIGPMSQEVLANIASNYSKEFRKTLVSEKILPRSPVMRPTGKFPVFSRSDLLFSPDAKLTSSKSQAVEVGQTHNVVGACVEKLDDPYLPTAGRTLFNEYAAGSKNGWIIRDWYDPTIGQLGGQYYQVGHEVDEVVVASDLIHVIKGAI